MTRAISLFVIALGVQAALAQPMYRWTDDQGRVHVTDMPPPPSAKNVRKSKTGAAAPADSGEQTPYELSLAIKEYPVSLYTSPMCKDPCQRARDHLNKRGVPFKEIQVWDVGSNEELKRVSGASQVPVLVVGASVHTGYGPGAFDELLDSAQYPKAGLLKPRAQAAPALPEGYTPPSDGGELKAQPAKPPAEEAKPRGPYAPR